MTVPVSVNGHSTGTMSMPNEFNIAKSKLSISDFPFTYGVSCSVENCASVNKREVSSGKVL